MAEEALRTTVPRLKAARAAFLAKGQQTATDAGADIAVFQERYEDYFYESIQGVASADNSPEQVVAKADAMALASLDVLGKEQERIDWMQVKLPHATVPDCVIVHGKLKGPKNHVLCSTHGHVIDSNQNMVIAHSIPEYEAARKAGTL